MSYIMEHTIQHYIADERARCRALADSIDDQALLLFCIDNVYSVEDLVIARKRFYELQPVDADFSPSELKIAKKNFAQPADNVEDLM